MDTARTAALDVLERCRRSNAWSSAAIDSVIKKYSLDPRSAALTSTLCLGVMQNCAFCDHYIDLFSSSKIEPKVRDILRCAVYQILFMDRIPDNAAVNEAVEQSKKLGYSRAAGFVNALLRKIAGSKASLPEIPGKGTAEYLSVKYSHPKPLVDMIVSGHGYGFAEQFLAANNTAPQTTIQINTLKTSTEEFEKDLSEAGIAFSRHEWLPGCYAVGGSITSVPGFDEGEFYVQDPAARSVIAIAGLSAGMKVLDACAAPGGKSFAAAMEMNNNGSILSCDIHEKKLSLIRAGAARLGINVIETEAADARTAREGLFDCVIADAPCSGFGVIRKKPEIRYKSPEETEGLSEIQLAILNNLCRNVRPGGVLVYSTCTVLQRENGDVVRAFLSQNNDFAAENFTLPNGRRSENGMYTFYPNIDDTDGFFVCKIRRTK